jgi:hypothetical protein
MSVRVLPQRFDIADDAWMLPLEIICVIGEYCAPDMEVVDDVNDLVDGNYDTPAYDSRQIVRNGEHSSGYIRFTDTHGCSCTVHFRDSVVERLNFYDGAIHVGQVDLDFACDQRVFDGCEICCITFLKNTFRFMYDEFMNEEIYLIV